MPPHHHHYLTLPHVHQSIRSSQPLHKIISAVNAGVLLLLAHGFVVRPGDCVDEAIEVWVAEVCHAVPGREPGLVQLSWRLDYAVLGALDAVIRPPRKQIACIDNDGVRDRGRVDVSVVRAEDL